MIDSIVMQRISHAEYLVNHGIRNEPENLPDGWTDELWITEFTHQLAILWYWMDWEGYLKDES